MNRGYVRIWRMIEDSGIMGNPEVCRLFLYLVLKASARSRTQMVGSSLVQLRPGQVVIGRMMLARELGATERKIRSCLQTLRKMGIIDLHPTSKFTLVSLVNWAKYQNVPRQDDQPIANERPAHDQPATTNKNEECKNASIPPTPGMAGPCPASRAARGAKGKWGKGVGEWPPEFTELRDHYDKTVREEAPGAGIAEYRQSLAAKTWPGFSCTGQLPITHFRGRDEAFRTRYRNRRHSSGLPMMPESSILRHIRTYPRFTVAPPVRQDARKQRP